MDLRPSEGIRFACLIAEYIPTCCKQWGSLPQQASVSRGHLRTFLTETPCRRSGKNTSARGGGATLPPHTHPRPHPTPRKQIVCRPSGFTQGAMRYPPRGLTLQPSPLPRWMDGCMDDISIDRNTKRTYKGEIYKYIGCEYTPSSSFFFCTSLLWG